MRKNKFIVGLTGGIGSGKSTVALVFKGLGVPVFDADKEAKKLYSDVKVKEEVIHLFGKNIYVNDEIDRQKISEIVFSNEEKLKQLESILYPYLNKKFEIWIEENKYTPYLIKEAALLIEKGTYIDLDRIILVLAPKDVRIGRVMARDGTSREEVIMRMDKQLSDDEKMKCSHFNIRNFEDLSIVKQVLDIHSELLELAKEIK